MSTDKNESFLKIIAVSVVAFVSFSMLTSLLFSRNSGYIGSSMMGRMHGNVQEGYYGGYLGSSWGLALLLTKLFWIVVIIIIVVSLLILVKKIAQQSKINTIHSHVSVKDDLQHCPQCNEEISDQFKFCPVCAAKLVQECDGCKRKVQWSWQCCPYCGRNKSNSSTEIKQKNSKGEKNNE